MTQSSMPRPDAAEPARAPARVAAHQVHVQRNREAGEYRAICTCGWSKAGPRLEAVEMAAAVHDLDPVPA